MLHSVACGGEGGLGVSEFFLRGVAWGMVPVIAGGVSVVARGVRGCCLPPHPRPLVSVDMDLFSSAGRQRWYDYLIPVCSRN